MTQTQILGLTLYFQAFSFQQVSNLSIKGSVRGLSPASLTDFFPASHPSLRHITRESSIALISHTRVIHRRFSRLQIYYCNCATTNTNSHKHLTNKIPENLLFNLIYTKITYNSYKQYLEPNRIKGGNRSRNAKGTYKGSRELVFQ